MLYALIGYSDFNYVANLDARGSVTGYTLMIGNFFISWKTMLQPTMSLSTIKAEYMAPAKRSKGKNLVEGSD